MPCHTSLLSVGDSGSACGTSSLVATASRARRREPRDGELAPMAAPPSPRTCVDLELQAAVLGHPQAAGGEAQAVDVEVDGVLDLAVELDDRAGGQVQRRAGRASACGRARPTRARGCRAARRPAGRRRVLGRSAPSSARSIRTTKALGTSCTRQAGHVGHLKLKVSRAAPPRRAASRPPRPRSSTTRMSRRGDLDLLAEHACGGQRGRRHHLVHRLADGAELEL